MAKVKITGHASGTGVITVTAPNTSTDRTITLPDGDVTLGAATPSITDNGNANAITIDSAENVGIGVTPEAWHNDYRNLAVGGTGALWSQKAVGTGKAMGVGQNVYYDGSNKYITTDEASRYYQANGVHTFEVAASGSADAAITWTDAMTIDNNGYVTKPKHPNFFAYSNAGNTAYGSGAEFIMNVEGTSCPHFNTSTGRFTAPVAGFYHFEMSVYTYDASKRFTIKKNGSDVVISGDTRGIVFADSGQANQIVNTCLSMNLAVNDYMSIGYKAGHSGNMYGAHTWFSGYLVG